MKKCGCCLEGVAKYVCCSPEAPRTRFLCFECLETHASCCAYQGNNMIVPLSQTIHGDCE